MIRLLACNIEHHVTGVKTDANPERRYASLLPLRVGRVKPGRYFDGA